MSNRRLGWIVVALLASFPARSPGMDITECGQTVPPNETGVLTVDLSFCNTAVKLGERASLQMNGHTISDCEMGVFIGARRFSITGPGTFTRTHYAVWHAPDRHSTFHVSDVTFDDNEVAIVSPPGTVLATNVVITNTGAEDPINSAGIAVYGVVAHNISVTGNFGFGTFASRRTVLFDSIVTGNNGGQAGIDVFQAKGRPRLINSTCGKSAGRNIGASGYGEAWGVCSND